MKQETKIEKQIEKAEHEMWKRCGMPDLCIYCGQMITILDRLFLNRGHCIIGDFHKDCGGEDETN